VPGYNIVVASDVAEEKVRMDEWFKREREKRKAG
jgi:hypothetical protein